jgi:hypothetical protein
MQTQSNHQRHLRHIFATLVGCTLSVLGAGCALDGEPDADGVEDLRSVELTGGPLQCVALIAGQHITVGSVCVQVVHGVDTSPHCGAGSSGAVKVTYQTMDGWELVEAHLAAGDEQGDIPTNNAGHPQPGQFPHHEEDLEGHTWHSFHVPLCVFGMDDSDQDCDPVAAHFAAHAVVKKDHGDWCQEETAWGEGEEFDTNGGWAMHFMHELKCEHEPC